MNRLAHTSNVRGGKAPVAHNRKPQATDMRVLRWRSWRRKANRWLRSMVHDWRGEA